MVTIVFILAVLLGLGLIASLLFTYIKYVNHASKIEALRFDLEMQDYRLKAMEKKIGTSERFQDRRRDGSVA